MQKGINIFARSDSASLRKHVGRKIEKKVGEGGRFTIQKYFCENLRNPYSSSLTRLYKALITASFSQAYLLCSCILPCCFSRMDKPPFVSKGPVSPAPLLLLPGNWEIFWPQTVQNHIHLTSAGQHTRPCLSPYRTDNRMNKTGAKGILPAQTLKMRPAGCTHKPQGKHTSQLTCHWWLHQD